MTKLTYRRIGRVLYPLSADQLTELRKLAPCEIFNIRFIRQFPALCEDLNNLQLGQYCLHLSGRLGGRRYQTFGDVLDLGYGQICHEVGSRWGAICSSLIFFEDMLTAFGIDLVGAPKPPSVDEAGSLMTLRLANEIVHRKESKS